MTLNNAKVLKGIVALYVSNDEWIVSRGYRLYKYNPKTNKKVYWTNLVDNKNGFLSRFRLSRRLFRAEITHLYHFTNDTWMCIAKKAIFKYDKHQGLFIKCCDIEKGSRPMCLCQTNDGTIYYGEYCYNPERKPMRIFQSRDLGETWNVAHTFKNDEINHIHGIFQDPYSNKVWVATGDDDKACIFGYTEDGFKTFVKQYEGSQQYRVCVPLFTEKEIIFATDSQYAQNVIRSINRETGEATDLCKIQGSGIYAVQNGDMLLVSTTVEPSSVNLDRSSHLWFSMGGQQWQELVSYPKDMWKETYFQFGSIRFPYYEDKCSSIVITGRAVRQLDGNTLVIPIKDIK